VEVSDWVKPGSSIDLGGRLLTVLSTPGHTSQSVSLLDLSAGWLFTGDLIYPTMLYAFLPGASISAYRQTADRLLTTLPPDTTLWAAHCCRHDEDFSAPWLSMDDLQDLERVLARVQEGQSESEGFFPRRFPVNRQMILGTGFRWNNR
jgi:glyoxylase-like metal-dependent hydrolase (beta-lactamase superfamily II)